ncbi:MAG: ABC transporter permease, partial [Caldilineaceae bacterium]|nr:ABC transporter permease [Caldilineaceae bacterium]
MPNLRWRYALRDLWLHKSRTLLVILSIAIGLFAFGLIAGAANTLRTQLPANYQAVVPAGARLHTTFFDDDEVDAIQRMPAVAAAEGRHSSMVRYQQPSGEWHDLQLFALEDYTNSRIDIVRPYQGAWPPADKTTLIERKSLALIEKAVGDSILVESAVGQQRMLPITGLTHDMNQAPAQITGVPYAYVTRDTLEWLGLSRDFNELHISVAQGRMDKAHITRVAMDAADKLEESGYTVFWTEVPNPGEHFIMDFLPTILLILTGLGVLALILSAFLVINVITAILTQQMRQIGVMK